MALSHWGPRTHGVERHDEAERLTGEVVAAAGADEVDVTNAGVDLFERALNDRLDHLDFVEFVE